MEQGSEGIEVTGEDGMRTSAGSVKCDVLDKMEISQDYSDVFAIWLTSPQLCELVCWMRGGGGGMR